MIPASCQDHLPYVTEVFVSLNREIFGWRVEVSFRFRQEEILHWEDFKFLDLEPIRCLVNVVLTAALFLLNAHYCLNEVTIGMILGSKLGLTNKKGWLLSGVKGMAEVTAPHQYPDCTQMLRQLDVLLQTLEAPLMNLG